MSKQILIIEDEIDIQNILKSFLEDAGHRVDTASDGLDGITAFRKSQSPYDLILLDIMMPKINGYAVCEMIRSESNTPIIILTALDEEENQIKAFDLQADDYITKPFSMPLVLKRIEAVLRRGHVNGSASASRNGNENGNENGNQVLSYKNIRIDPEGYQIFVSGEPVSLTAREFEILKLFVEHPGRVFKRSHLMNLIWNYDFAGDDKIVNTHIKNIRKKLGVDYIETIRGVGYKIDKEN